MSTIARAVAVVGSLYGLLRNRLGLSVATPLGAQELSATIAPDRRLVVLGHEPIAGFTRDHGTIADEAAMLALHTLDSATLLVEPTFVAPGDSCIRTDDPGWRWHCVAGHGTALADWERRPLSGALAGKQAASANLTALASVASTAAGRATLALATPDADKMLVAHADDSVTTEDIPSGGGWTESENGPEPGYIDCAWTSNGDTNGVIYKAGTAGGGAFANPVTAGLMRTLKSTTAGGVADSHLTSRADNGGYTYNVAGSWLVVDLHDFAIIPSGYTLQNYIYASDYIRSWKLQGTNSCDWTIDGVAAASWVDIDTRTNDTTIQGVSEWGHWSVTGVSAGYRYLRILQTGVNATDRHYLAVAQIEIYGRMVATTPVSLPASARGWLVDGADHFVPFYR